MQRFTFADAALDIVMPLITRHAASLSSPWDSYFEGEVLGARHIAVRRGDDIAGYVGLDGDRLVAFFIAPPHYRHAPDILECAVAEYGISRALVLTNDPLFCSLIAEWECHITTRNACLFIDGAAVPKPSSPFERPAFRPAEEGDIDSVIAATGDFFDRPAEYVLQNMIFLLESGGELLGCGIIEPGRISADCASIGMITAMPHRRKGVAALMLWHLKELCFKRGLRPIAGCWYYNSLSRKSLENAGMLAAGKAFTVELVEKNPLPLRTGNPPGEDV